MKRSEFLKWTLGAAAAAIGLGASGCKSGGSTTPTNPDDKTFTGTNVQSHTHSVTVRKADVQNPPAGGVSYTTSSNSGHSHTLSLSQAELQSVNAGTPVTVMDSLVSSHQHQYQISKWF